jgi:hypothetical protein
MIEMFKLLSSLKYIKKQKLIVDIEDEKIMYNYYKLIRRIKNIKYNKFREIIINYRIDNLKGVEDSCIYYLQLIKNSNTMNE